MGKDNEAKKKRDAEIRELKRRIAEENDPVLKAARNVPMPSVMCVKSKDAAGHISRRKRDEPAMRIFEAHDMDEAWELSYLCNIHIRVVNTDTDAVIEARAHEHAYILKPHMKYYRWQLFEWRDDGHIHPFGSVVPARVEKTEEELLRVIQEKKTRRRDEQAKYRLAAARHKKTQIEKMEYMSDEERYEFVSGMTIKQRRYNLTRLVKKYISDVRAGIIPSARRKLSLIRFCDECSHDGVITVEAATRMKKEAGVFGVSTIC